MYQTDVCSVKSKKSSYKLKTDLLPFPKPHARTHTYIYFTEMSEKINENKFICCLPQISHISTRQTSQPDILHCGRNLSNKFD
jgi:hypothetical protein